MTAGCRVCLSVRFWGSKSICYVVLLYIYIAHLNLHAPVYRGHTALGTFLYPGQHALCTFLDQGLTALGTTRYFRAGSPGSIFGPRASSPRYIFGPRAVCPGYNTVLQGRQPYIQHGTSGQAALGTFLYQGLPALCTFLDQGQSALSTRRYFRAVSTRYIGGTRGGVRVGHGRGE